MGGGNILPLHFGHKKLQGCQKLWHMFWFKKKKVFLSPSRQKISLQWEIRELTVYTAIVIWYLI